MNDIEFTDINELYNRLLPALKTRVNDLRRNGYEFINIELLWNALISLKWKNASNLELFDMVEQILHIDIEDILKYHNNCLNK